MITEQEPITYRGFLIFNCPYYDGLPGPKKYQWQNPNYDGGTNDWGTEDTIEECVEAIDQFLESGVVHYPDEEAWSGGFADNH